MSKLMKLALIATGLLNMVGAILFMPIFPRLRQSNGFPGMAHPLYLWIISIWIFLFGICYLWLGVTGKRERLFLIIGSAGKLSFVGLLFIYWSIGELPLQTAISSLADLFFALIFLFYLWQTRSEEL
jgi:hypothetical protein